jgi:hypothetical protein
VVIMRRRLSIARPSHRMCAVSQPLGVGRLYPSQVTCAGKDHLLRVGPFIIARRYTYWVISHADRAVAARTGYWLDHCASLFELTGDCYTNFSDLHGNTARLRLHRLRDEARAARNVVFPPLRYEPVRYSAWRQVDETPTCDDAYASLQKIGRACAEFAWSALSKPERYEMDAPFETLFPVNWSPPGVAVLPEAPSFITLPKPGESSVWKSAY